MESALNMLRMNWAVEKQKLWLLSCFIACILKIAIWHRSSEHVWLCVCMCMCTDIRVVLCVCGCMYMCVCEGGESLPKFLTLRQRRCWEGGFLTGAGNLGDKKEKAGPAVWRALKFMPNSYGHGDYSAVTVRGGWGRRQPKVGWRTGRRAKLKSDLGHPLSLHALLSLLS